MPKSGTETRRAILIAASQIVQEEGVERLTLETTAKRAGISKGGLLYHFPNKEALIIEMVRDYLDRFSSDLAEAAASEAEGAPGRWTRAYVATTFEDHQRTPHMSSGMLAAIATAPSLLTPLQNGFQDWMDLLEKDGLDPMLTHIIRLATDGLWLVELFGLAPPDAATKDRLLKSLQKLSTLQVAELAEGSTR